MLINPVKPIHIAIDARMYGVAQRGIGKYLMKLIEHLEQIVPSPSPLPKGEGGRRPGEGHTFTIFLRQENFDEYRPKNPNFKKALWDAPWYGLREQLRFQPLLRQKPLSRKKVKNRMRAIIHDREQSPAPYSPAQPHDLSQYAHSIDLYHFSHWNVPLLFRRPFVVTIHDLELFSSNRTRSSSTRGRTTYWLKHLAFRIVFRHAVLASRAIIVPSNFVREQLLDRYPQVRNKVQVIYEAPTIEGVGTRALGTSTSPNPKPYHLAPSPYTLYVGAAYPHKNLPRLLEAWQIVHKELPDYKLVLVGREDYFWKKLKSTSYVLRPTSSIVFYGSATDAELSALYKNASLLVQPSLEEGFSLSPLEALAHGTPAAVSDIAVHREILEDAAFFFNPRNAQTMASAIKNALLDQPARLHTLNRRKSVLGRYSWKNHAEKTLQIYETALKV